MNLEFASLWEGSQIPDPLLLSRPEFLEWMETCKPDACEGLRPHDIIKMRRYVASLGQRPPMAMAFEDLTVQVPAMDLNLPSLRRAVTSVVTAPRALCREKKLYTKLQGITGHVKHGEMVLVLAPPSSGSSTLLRVLMNQTEGCIVSGEVTYNERPQKDVTIRTCHMDEEDHHLPALSVYKTFKVAAEMSTPTAWPDRKASVERYVERVMGLLGLTHQRDTLVGSALIRGVSGGEKKRVSLGEALLSQGQVMGLDGWSRGLDSATALSIGRTLRALVNASGVPCISSLYQVGPDLFSLFDSVLVLAGGRQLFFGSVDAAMAHFSRAGLSLAPKQTIPDFLTTISGHAKGRGAHLLQMWEDSDDAKKLQEGIRGGVVDDIWKQSDEEISAYRGQYQTSFLHHLLWLLWREYHLLTNNLRQYLLARVGRYIFQGLIIGGLFFQLSHSEQDAHNRLGLLYNTMNTLGTGTFALMPDILEQRHIFYRQKHNKLHVPAAWPIAKAIFDIPLAFMEALIFGTIVYWMAGLHRVASDFTFLILMLWVFNLALSNFVRLCVYLAPDTHYAQGSAGNLVILFSIFCGFMRTQTQIPLGWKWMYYLSPYTYMLRAILVNEFDGQHFNIDYHGRPIAVPGETYIEKALDITDSADSKWHFMGYMASYCTGFILLSAFAASVITHVPQGTILRMKRSARRLLTNREAAEEADDGLVSCQVNISPSGSYKTKGAHLVWKDVRYEVPVKGEKEPKRLLHGVSGDCRPGMLVALMGPTGAGKTTLLDVLARRKTTGRSTGEVLVNGHTLTDGIFQRVTGYVEQEDLHIPRCTVREAIEFSASLRLDNTTPEQKREAVDDTIRVLGLQDLEGVMIGSDKIGGGISLEARKRVTIAVELVAGPRILFMDEPTSGLDTKGSLAVMQCAREIAREGKTVVCTIHQPSEELFSVFDTLLLMHHGRLVYFGPVGPDGKTVADYFRRHGAGPMLSKYKNIAEAVMAIVKSPVPGTDKQWADLWDQSQECTALSAQLTSSPVVSPASHRDLISLGEVKAAPIGVQFLTTLSRQLLVYWRMPSYVALRIAVTLWTSFLLGTLYHGADDPYSCVTVLFVTCILGLIAGITTMQPVFEGRAPFYRETAAGAYRPGVYAMVAVLTELPTMLLCMVIHSCFVYFMTDYPTAAFPFFFASYVAFSMTMQFLGMAVAALVPSLLLGQVILPVLAMLWNLHGGFLIISDNIPTGLKGFYYANPFNYFLRSNTVNILQRMLPPEGTPDDTIRPTLILYGWMRKDGSLTIDIWADLAILYGMAAFFIISYILLTMFVRHVKR